MEEEEQGKRKNLLECHINNPVKPVQSPGVAWNSAKSRQASLGAWRFQTPSEKSYTLQLPAAWSGRIWGRHGCAFDAHGRGKCATGDCGGALFFNGIGGAPPATLAEITLGSDQDFYDVSLVDGYNLAISITPIKGTGKCTYAGCVNDLNMMCHVGLQDAIENMGNETSESMFSASIEEGDQECPSVSKPGKRKRSKDSAEKNLISMFDDVSSKLGSLMENVNTHLGKLIASESDDMTIKVMDALTQMEGLSSGQVLEAAEILMAEPHKLKVFYHGDGDDMSSSQLFTSDDMMKGFQKCPARRKKIRKDKENMDINKSNGSSSPMYPLSEIFNKSTASSLKPKPKLSFVNKSLNIQTSSSGAVRSIDMECINKNYDDTMDRQPLSNITNQKSQSISRSQKEKGKRKLLNAESTRNLFEEEFKSPLPERSDDYYDQLEHSIIGDSEYNEDGADDSNDEYCTEEPWGDIGDIDSDVESLPSSSKLPKKTRRSCEIPEDYATLGAPSVKCTQCNALMWKEEGVNKNVTKGTPIFSFCCKKGDVKLANALAIPPYLLQLYNDEVGGSWFSSGNIFPTVNL
ncbi:hypothetical protein POM88_035354 [Heracleum sosnowskyi]|uniref:Uncharacterized protein n=1 Tax=Heracleum sosnowskyi TaxID=360622 RepID=A0AAD8HL34_9APIA|nr:hypothetical protein POM88_035354 [Heracleum sosnowskyi]